jgi:hypothetical protein
VKGSRIKVSRDGKLLASLFERLPIKVSTVRRNDFTGKIDWADHEIIGIIEIKFGVYANLFQSSLELRMCTIDATLND